jgi:serine/threonine-protein kinase RsbW
MFDETCIWQCDRTIPNDTGAGRKILEEVLAQLTSQQWPAREVFAIHLATDEALVNAIVHGNKLEPSKHVRFRCRIGPQKVRIEIQDEGAGFDPDSLPDPTSPCRIGCPSGRGVMLMRTFMSRVEFHDRGNHVVMEKDRDPGATSDASATESA